MKLKDISKPVDKFTPFTLAITFETEDELREMSHRMNVGTEALMERFHTNMAMPENWGISTPLFDAICIAMEDRGMQMPSYLRGKKPWPRYAATMGFRV